MELLSKHKLQAFLEGELEDAKIVFLDQDFTLRLERSTKKDGEWVKHWMNIEFHPNVENPNSYWVAGGEGFGKDYGDRFNELDELVKYIKNKLVQ